MREKSHGAEGPPRYRSGPLWARKFTGPVTGILQSHGALAQEPTFLLRKELREVERYSTVLGALAIGHRTANAIAAYAGVAKRAMRVKS